MDLVSLIVSLVALGISIGVWIDTGNQSRHSILCELEQRLDDIHAAFLDCVNEFERTGGFTSYHKVNAALDLQNNFITTRFKYEASGILAAWVKYRYFLTEDKAKLGYESWKQTSAATHNANHKALVEAVGTHLGRWNSVSRVLQRR